MTEWEIEVHVEKRTDKIDAWYMAGKITSEEYDIALKNLDTWAQYQYEHATGRGV